MHRGEWTRRLRCWKPIFKMASTPTPPHVLNNSLEPYAVFAGSKLLRSPPLPRSCSTRSTAPQKLLQLWPTSNQPTSLPSPLSYCGTLVPSQLSLHAFHPAITTHATNAALFVLRGGSEYNHGPACPRTITTASR